MGDFFDPSSIPKCDVIFMKHILHDWNDAKCKEILKACHEVLHSAIVLRLFENSR